MLSLGVIALLRALATALLAAGVFEVAVRAGGLREVSHERRAGAVRLLVVWMVLLAVALLADVGLAFAAGGEAPAAHLHAGLTVAGWVAVGLLAVPPLLGLAWRGPLLQGPVREAEARLAAVESDFGGEAELPAARVEAYLEASAALRKQVAELERALKGPSLERVRQVRTRLNKVEERRRRDLARHRARRELDQPRPRWDEVLRHLLVAEPGCLEAALLDADHGGGTVLVAVSGVAAAVPGLDPVTARELTQRLLERLPQHFLERAPDLLGADRDAVRRRAVLEFRHRSREQSEDLLRRSGDWEALAWVRAASGAEPAAGQSSRNPWTHA